MTPDHKAHIYFAAATFGGIASLLLLVTTALGAPDFLKGFCIGMMLVSLVLLLVRRLRDEYVEELWRAGASAAFLTVVACFVFAPMIEGFYDGLTGAVADREWPAALSGILAIVAFFAAFHWKWLRSAR